jgi:hypothetical protein
MLYCCVALDCLPSSLYSGGGEQVDMARKLQEDPLYAIRKKEIESRTQILKNPVKLKQLQELVSMSIGVIAAFMLGMSDAFLIEFPSVHCYIAYYHCQPGITFICVCLFN